MNFLKKLRKKHNLKQHQLANVLGCTQQEISRIESGKNDISISKFITICKAVGEEDYNSILKD